MLKGIAWQHTRAMAPLHALSEVWRDLRGQSIVTWDSRSLKAFAETPLDEYPDYDLIIFDYPFAGEALDEGWVIGMETLLDPQVIEARRQGCVGRTLASFEWQGGIAALPIDAATHVCAWREDLSPVLPSNWAETIALARSTGKVVMPMTPTAIWGALITLCAHRGAPPMHPQAETAFNRDIAVAALADIAALAVELPSWCFTASPVAVLNRMSMTDDFGYCPLTYGYSVYAMQGYAQHPLRFGDIRIDAGQSPNGAILGGAGIGVLAGSQNPQAAAQLAAWLTSDSIQGQLYPQFGGQPAARAGWTNPVQDALAGGFYADTLATMTNCYHRPNLPGFHAFQTQSANALHAMVQQRSPAEMVLDKIDAEWQRLIQTVGNV
ncbi:MULTISPECIES: extracellular solute-binding protein [unclassified Sphingomonas]|uniref:extracellular solute-binding protein n=1 Tax=unclassified Sphingomonas TaxID=196159 RepID=UPI000BC80593|nr:MAG: hypothetical protein B7Y98_00995 [Sphingomonas sp. 32-62-10]